MADYYPDYPTGKDRPFRRDKAERDRSPPRKTTTTTEKCISTTHIRVTITLLDDDEDTHEIAKDIEGVIRKANRLKEDPPRDR